MWPNSACDGLLDKDGVGDGRSFGPIDRQEWWCRRRDLSEEVSSFLLVGHSSSHVVKPTTTFIKDVEGGAKDVGFGNAR
jgi:hypothetical protein